MHNQDVALVEQGVWDPCARLLERAELDLGPSTTRQILFTPSSGVLNETFRCVRRKIFDWCELMSRCVRWYSNALNRAVQHYVRLCLFPIIITSKYVDVRLDDIGIDQAISILGQAFADSYQKIVEDILTREEGQSSLGIPVAVRRAFDVHVPDPENVNLGDFFSHSPDQLGEQLERVCLRNLRRRRKPSVLEQPDNDVSIVREEPLVAPRDFIQID
eukprot:Blabericola_migrator_1__8991@NODE_478_length_8196_cov_107_510026_g372_i0_p3_GENE_NODE_478_length_8196_cov_107_510026_g372_i0NODE_478_length_8196_cov_107_510026_g372_i0_p3_ORF_typecomplete_len217_score40_38_NODE_478_length_8196_cov_107_510026_g372_i066237273